MAARQRQTYGEEVANVLTHGAGMLFGMTAIIILMMAALSEVEILGRSAVLLFMSFV